jgi:hypothetical protein
MSASIKGTHMQETTFTLSPRLRRVGGLLLLAVVAGALWAATRPASTPRAELTPQLRSQLIDSLDTAFRKSYVYADKAEAAVGLMRERQRAGAFDGITDHDRLAEKLRETLAQETGNDQHLRIGYDAPTPATALDWDSVIDSVRFGKDDGAKDHHGVPEAKVLADNVGYLRVDSFYPANVSGPDYAAAMTKLAGTRALIIDLRDARAGGEPDGVALLSSYLFDQRTHLNDLYFREGDRTTAFWTDPNVPGKRFGQQKPVYVLTGSRTFSGAEEFSYNLQQLERATLVGETTRGGANPGRMHELSPYFAAFFPGGGAINPISKTNWEGTGVTPDIKVPVDQALETAHKLALEKLAKPKS